ncbi:M16 family metallopeptidase [Varibaculum prostatecancerukia]|uniref:M16 family metallopeptidase n=1 Tax=Varibaculum prostatecancerukia TaxID=2811781 RepID=UPI001C008D14|nr:pitrilysin family protein [Varibaculum prostatecancerukia]
MPEKNYYELPLSAKAPRLRINEGETLIERSVLAGGIRLITQQVPASPSVVLGFWIPAGSRDEGPDHLGSTHYLEHLLFKGSATRDAREISRAFDAVGGELNAATAKESTHYYCRVLSRDLPMAVEVLTEMLARPTLAPADFELERAVILDELAMSQDDPQDVCYEKFLGQLYPTSPLGLPVGGTAQTVAATPLEAVKAHHQRWYQPQHLTVAAAGDIEHDRLAQLILAAAEKNGWELPEQTDPKIPQRTRPEPGAHSSCTVEKTVEQGQIILGTRSLPANDPQRDALSLLLTVLSGGMSSRLFQEIREKRGLAYSTYAFDSAYSDSGAFGLYAGCAPTNLAQVGQLLAAELEKLADNPVGEQELSEALGQLSGGVLLGMDDNRARMARLGRSEVNGGRLRTIEQLNRALREVTGADIAVLAGQFLGSPQVKVVVSPAVA